VEELVGNGFDAFAERVFVYLPGSHSDLLMVWDDVGKFGIGKLAGYAVGNRITHLCRRDKRFLEVSIDYRAVPKIDPDAPPPEGGIRTGRRCTSSPCNGVVQICVHGRAIGVQSSRIAGGGRQADRFGLDFLRPRERRRLRKAERRLAACPRGSPWPTVGVGTTRISAEFERYSSQEPTADGEFVRLRSQLATASSTRSSISRQFCARSSPSSVFCEVPKTMTSLLASRSALTFETESSM
jgi:hypothetical protein